MQRRHVPPGRTSISQEIVMKPSGPHQPAACSASVHALNTRRRGASKIRVMTSSRCADATSALALAVIVLLARLQLAEIIVQAIEALLPEVAVVLQPVGGVLERPRLEPAGPPLGLAAARDQAGSLQHLEMLGHGRKAHLEGLGQLRDRSLARGEAGEDRAPCGIREGCISRA